MKIVTCDGCGACCSEMRTPPFIRVDDPEWDRVPADLKAEIDKAVFEPLDVRPDGSPCLWLGDDKRCAHYDLRPGICREFERGSDACRRWRVELRIDGKAVPAC